MSFKIQLVHKVIGTLNLVYDDADGLEDFGITLERSQDSDGVIYNFSSALKFPSDGREFLKIAYEQYGGIEAQVIANIFEYNPNTYQYFLNSTGQINFVSYVLAETTVTANIDKRTFDVQFTNLIAQDVNFSDATFKNGEPNRTIDGVTLKLQPKTILKELTAKGSEGNNYFTNIGTSGGGSGDGTFVSTLLYGKVDSQNLILNEIGGTNKTGGFGYPAIISQTLADITAYNDLQTDEEGPLTLHVKGKFTTSFAVEYSFNDFGTTIWTSLTYEIGLRLNITDQFGVQISDSLISLQAFVIPQTNSGIPLHDIGVTMVFNFDDVALSAALYPKGTRFILYTTTQVVNTVPSPPSGGGPFASVFPRYVSLDSEPGALIVPHTPNNCNYTVISDINMFFDFQQATTFPVSTCQAVMVYELLQRLCQYYTSQTDCFRSNVLGRTDLILPDGSSPYLVDGDAALIAFTNGWAIRDETNARDRELFFNFQEIFNSITAAFCLSWGFETLDNGTRIVRVEKKGYFFNNQNVICTIPDTPVVEQSVDTDYYYLQVKAGYPDIKQIKQINATDEFNQGRLYATPFTQATTVFDITSPLSASGYEIESQRRQSIVTSDSPLDNSRFMICVLRDGAPVAGIQAWKNEQAVGFSGITGLYDPATSYNLRIRPGENMRRWNPYFAGQMFRSTNKTMKFASGTGNYNLVCQGPGDAAAFSENSNIDLTGVMALFLPEIYSFEWFVNKLTWAAIQDNVYGYILFSNLGVMQQGYIKQIEKKGDNKKTQFTLLRSA